MKLNKENAGFIFIIVILVALLGLSIYLGMSGWYFYSEENYTTDLQLGKTVQASIKDNQASALSLNIEGSFLPGEWLPQVVAVKNTNDSGAVYLRAKAYIDNGNNVSSPLTVNQTANWTYREEDGYYYFNDFLSFQNKTSLCSSVVMPNDLLLQTTKKYIATFVFETLDSQQDVTLIWKCNPIVIDEV